MTTLTQPDPPAVTTRSHEHGWTVESAHRTSEGRLLYVRCPDCGARRVDLQAHPDAPPTPVSATVSPGGPSPRPVGG